MTSVTNHQYTGASEMVSEKMRSQTLYAFIGALNTDALSSQTKQQDDETLLETLQPLLPCTEDFVKKMILPHVAQ